MKAITWLAATLSCCLLLALGAAPTSARPISDNARKYLSRTATTTAKPAPTSTTTSSTTTPVPNTLPTTTRTTRLASGVQYTAMWQGVTDADQKSMAAAIAQSGSRWARLDVAWATLQPTGPGSYDLGWGVPMVDRAVANATDAGLDVLLTLYWAPEWATVGTGKAAHPDPAAYARAAQWVAARYKGKVKAIEVWNEQNGARFWNPADPVAYTRLLQAAYPAIKAGNPDALVVMGGLEYSDTAFLQQMYDAGVKGSYDVNAFHPYPAIADQSPLAPWDGTKWTVANMKTYMDVMARNGDTTPVWLTELGWSTHTNWTGVENWNRGVSDAVQADYLTQMYTLVNSQYPQVTALFWYTVRDTALGNVQQDHYGLVRTDWSRKPAFAALQAANLALSLP
jgi:hypothetical protein